MPAISAPEPAAPAAATREVSTPEIQQFTRNLYDRVSKSLVAVQYTWESEMGRREVVGSGLIVSDSGIVTMTMSLVDLRIPDEQMKDFKVLLPSETSDVEELDAVFLGRDERSDLGFVQIKEKRDWTPVKFVDRQLSVGEPLWSVGILPKMAGYKPYIMESKAAALLRGELPQVLVSGRLAAMGSPVFNASGEAVGLVSAQSEQLVLLNEPKAGLTQISRPPVLFVASRGLLRSIADPPKGEPLKLPWIGVMQMIGLQKEVAEYFGLKGQTAVQLGDTIPGGPAEKAGIKAGEIITRVNGQPIVRGDEPEELPMILRRQLLHMKPGEIVTFTILDPRTRNTRDVPVTLQERPAQPNLAKRYYAEDMGFSVREMVFMDRYQMKLEADETGVIVALTRPQSAAHTARLEGNDMIVELNGQPVAGLEQFKSSYEQFRKERPQDAVVLVVLREGRNQTIRIEPPR